MTDQPQPPSELRLLLADRLVNHTHSVPFGHCYCGRECKRDSPADWARHVADVLLSMPGIAIVDANELVALHDLGTDIHSAIEEIWERRAVKAEETQQ